MAALVAGLRRGFSSSTLLRKEIETASATAGGHGGGWKFWRSLSFFVGLPSVAICMANAYLTHSHHDPPEFIKYEYLSIRTKKFPWGDGNHSLFHNPHTNALPDGYETTHH